VYLAQRRRQAVPPWGKHMPENVRKSQETPWNLADKLAQLPGQAPPTRRNVRYLSQQHMKRRVFTSAPFISFIQMQLNQVAEFTSIPDLAGCSKQLSTETVGSLESSWLLCGRTAGTALALALGQGDKGN